MERKANMGLGALKIIGLIYTGLGGLFFIMGIIFWMLLPEETTLIGIIFTAIGGVFLLMGLIFLYNEIKKQQTANRLLAEGRFIMGEVVDLTYNTNVTVNGQHPTVVLVRCVDSQGKIHIYRSRNVNGYVDHTIIGSPVRIYTEDIGAKDYYIDLEDILPQVIEH